MTSTSVQNRPCVLVVEPDAITRDLLQIALERAGFGTISAQTGEHALLVLREQRAAVDWLVTRQTLPGLVDGPVLADEFHVHHPSRPVLTDAGAAGVRQGTLRTMNLSSPDEIVGEVRALSTSVSAPQCSGEKQALAA